MYTVMDILEGYDKSLAGWLEYDCGEVIKFVMEWLKKLEESGEDSIPKAEIREHVVLSDCHTLDDVLKSLVKRRILRKIDHYTDGHIRYAPTSVFMNYYTAKSKVLTK